MARASRTAFLLVLVAATDAFELPRASRNDGKQIQRLAQHDTVPKGWRLADADDATSNRACFRLVLRRWDTAQLEGGFKVSGAEGGSNPVRWSAFDPMPPEPLAPAETCAQKVVVRFNRGDVLGRERAERIACRVGKAVESYMQFYLALDVMRLVLAIPRYAVLESLFVAASLVYSLLVLRSEWIQRLRGSV